MTFLSLFAGVGGFDLALVRLSMRCVGQVELDPVCRSVLARHFPEVARHDDIHTTIAWWHTQPRPPVDLVCAGWPCQDLSQAGRRAGLAGPRSGLFFDLARVVDALRPGWLLLENVPGLLTSNQGADFQTVLDTLVQLGYGVAWRVLDARYFGVAQRRRRVWLAGRRGAHCPFEVLFEPPSGQGDPAPGGPSRPAAATAVAAGTATRGRPRPAGRHCGDDHDLVASTLTANYGDGSPRGDAAANLLPISGPADGQLAATLLAGQGGLRTTDLNTPLVTTQQAEAGAEPRDGGRVWSLSENQRGELLTADIAASLMVGGGKPGQGYPAVLITPHAPTPSDLEAQPAVAGDAAASTTPAEGSNGGRRNQVAVSGTLLLQPGAAPRPGGKGPTRAATTRSTGNGDPRQPMRQGEPPAVMVRRLTPTECERLQGFPDQWTATDPDGRPLSDTARYRLVGNAATVPVVAWIAARLQAAHHATASTLDRRRPGRPGHPAGTAGPGGGRP
jgi:DNA (cytosine-5)-methyltransferase 1